MFGRLLAAGFIPLSVCVWRLCELGNVSRSSLAFAVRPHSAPFCSVLPDAMSDLPRKRLHVKARTSPYPGSKVQRHEVPDCKVSWSVEWLEYRPPEHTNQAVLAGPVWADPHISEGSEPPLQFNVEENDVNRKSFEGSYEVIDGRPRNPFGRTGLKGRGLLGRWGPNHAADPIITRWKRNGGVARVTHPVSGHPILQFVSIQRRDSGEWAIPGGMVDPGEKISMTLKREFGEEALNMLKKSEQEKRELQEKLQKLFSQEHLEVYKGYVDDPRNTDNAWIETVAINYHDESGEILEQLALEAGDDAGKVKWVDMDQDLKLYASHVQFIEKVARKRGAHWGGSPGEATT
ncbi:ADP-ribose pyrophosphatase, mitochondrial isoform X1 [Latimeria chalumnae]|uniref:ADP-ribose pyrophosphatase, mitochondrial isoform X1 n=1 Tax=Latimeria chalumnae TaxID=7897 RepID=UPI00313E6189